MNYDSTIINISICSTEISFTLNSEYENINELSDYKYTKDKKLRERISNILKGKGELISKSNSKSSSDSEKNKINKESKKYEFSKFKMTVEKKRRQSISFFQSSNSNFSNHLFDKFQGNDKDNKKLKQQKTLSKKISIHKKMNTRENTSSKGKRQSLLITLNQNIERNQINLNNPDLFYQEYFQSILDKNKGKDIQNEIKDDKLNLQNSLTKMNSNINFNNIINPGQT
jgi:hypothetical protein